MIVDRLILWIQVKTGKLEANVLRVQKMLDKMWASQKAEKLVNHINRLSPLFLSMGMALLFTGMAIKRYFETALRGLITTYMGVAGQTDIVSDKFYDLQAYLIFLKYSFMDAFAQTGLLDRWIERVTKLMDWFNNLDESTKATIVNILVWGSIIGTVMMVAGMALLFLLGPLSLIKYLFEVPLKKAVMGLGKFFLVILVIVGAIWVAMKIWNSKMEKSSKLVYIIALAFIALGVILLLTVGWVGLIAIAIGAVIAVGWRFRYELGLIFLYIGKAIQDYVLVKLQKMIDFINDIIRLTNRLLHTNYAEIGPIKGYDFDAKIAEYERKRKEIAEKESWASMFGTKGKSLKETFFEGMMEKASPLGTSTQFIFNGDVYGIEDFESKVAEALEKKQNFGIGTPQS